MIDQQPRQTTTTPRFEPEHAKHLVLKSRTEQLIRFCRYYNHPNENNESMDQIRTWYNQVSSDLESNVTPADIRESIQSVCRNKESVLTSLMTISWNDAKNRLPPLQFIVDQWDIDVNLPTVTRSTPLNNAIQCKLEKEALFLIDRGASICPHMEGKKMPSALKTFVQCSKRNNYDGGSLILQRLLQRGSADLRNEEMDAFDLAKESENNYCYQAGILSIMKVAYGIE